MLSKYFVVLASTICVLLPSNKLLAAGSQQDFESALRNGYGELRATEGEFAGQDIVLAAKAPELVFWNVSWEDLNINCEKSFKLNGNNLAVKLGFIRGNFDSYSQTYKAEPIVALRNVDGNFVYPFIRVGQRIDNTWNTGTASGRVSVEFQAKTVAVTDSYNTAQSVSIPYSELVAKWNEHASAFCSWHLGKKYCLVPQNFWDGSYHQSGFVLAEGSPLSAVTAFPQDYVALFREEPDTFTPSYRPIVYSLALRLAFVLSPNQKNVWEIRQMTAAEIGEAMVERISKRALFGTTSGTYAGNH